MLNNLDISIVLGRTLREEFINQVQHFLREYIPHTDIVTNAVRVMDLPAIQSTIYMGEAPIEWSFIFRMIRMLKGYLEEREVSVTQLIVLPHMDRGSLDNFSHSLFRLIRNTRGAWTRPELFDDLAAHQLQQFIDAHGGRRLGDGWYVLPFDQDVTGDHDLCSPEDIPTHFSLQMNGSTTAVGAPVGLRVLMTPGSAITDYISHAYNIETDSDNLLGGSNVILTTLLQMNDKLAFVNTYCEPLDEPVALDLLSLSAMNLQVTDERADTDIATLVRNGKLIVSDIIIGG